MGGKMKDSINKIDREFGYSNSVLAKRLGVSEALIHKHRKNRNPLIDRSMKRLLKKKFILPKDIKTKDIENVRYSRMDIILIAIRKFFIKAWSYVRKT